jgi:hypothetical protein
VRNQTSAWLWATKASISASNFRLAVSISGDQSSQNLAPCIRDRRVKAVLDQVGCRHARCVVMEIFSKHLENKYLEKKSRASSPALKIVSTLFPRKVGFDLD